jgi:hypothetical protein
MADLTLKGFRDQKAIDTFVTWFTAGGGGDMFWEFIDMRNEDDELFTNLGASPVWDEDGNAVVEATTYDKEE